MFADRMATEETPMEFIVWVETRLAGKTLAVEEVATFDRCCRVPYQAWGCAKADRVHTLIIKTESSL